ELNLLVHLGGEDFGQVLALAEPRQVVREEPIRVQAKLFEQAAIGVCTKKLLPQSLCSLNLLFGQALNDLTLQVTGDTLTGSWVPQERLEDVLQLVHVQVDEAGVLVVGVPDVLHNVLAKHVPRKADQVGVACGCSGSL